jgi:serine/threonine-protein kinase HipA
VSFNSNEGGVLVSTTFRYADSWLSAPAAYDLSPELPRGLGVRIASGQRVIPGAIADTGPDRWGQNLLFAAERRDARRESRRIRSLNAGDFILMARDETRHGALRFSDDGGESFLSAGRGDVPTLVDLDDLVAAGRRQSRDRSTDSDLELLTRAGTSMGGARPKVTVRTESGRLALAKLPSTEDTWDVQAWEATALELARRAGVSVPKFAVYRLDADSSVLVVDRFDRRDDGRRVGYMSAHSMVEKVDGTAVSYVELADILGDHSGEPAADRTELFRRIVLSLLINNVDDHMKNHGFLRAESGWRLSPAFDINPFPSGRPVDSTAISLDGSGATRDVDELIGQAGFFGLTDDEAGEIVVAVEVATRDWAEIAASFGVEEPEDGAVATAFDTPARDQARVLASGQ